MVEYGSVDQIINNPQEDYTKSLVSVRSILKEEGGDLEEEPVLNCRNITASYSNAIRVLHDVSMHLHKGQTLAIVGESGSGKSTMARVITGLLPQESGDIYFKGEPLPRQLKQRTKEELRSLQMIYQMADTAMNPAADHRRDHRPADRVLLRRLGQGKTRKQVIELLEKIELDDSFL